MNIVFIGASGCGKGTQAKLLATKHNFCHISMGDLLREFIKSGTTLGNQVAEIVNNGKLVPTELTIKLLEEKIGTLPKDQGIILDGFPRSLEQAEALRLPVDLVIVFKNDVNKLVARLVNRRTCAKCGNIFNLLSDGNLDKCPACGGELTMRKDDQEEAIKSRFAFYNQSTLPLVEYYKARTLVKEVDADKTKDEVLAQIEGIINQYDKNIKK